MMAEIATKFPPQTYCSSFYLNKLPEEDVCVNGIGAPVVGKKRSRNKEPDDNTGPILDCFVSAMLHFFYLLLLPIFFPLTSSAAIVECVLPSNPQTRTFPSLLDYQHNSQSFSVSGAGYAGNIIEFSFQSIDKIPKNAFITFTSQYIWKITLSGKKIKQIDDGAFLNLNCLHELDLSNNSLSGLSEGLWEGLRGLVWLKLNRNLIGELRNLVFRQLVGLKHLDLSRNRIVTIGVETFDGLGKLETLDLSYNLLRNIHPETFTPLGKLDTLQLNSNHLQNVQPQLWKNLTKLTNLNLADNSLTSFDPTYNFSFHSLITLNLSMNLLTKLNVYPLRQHFPVLRTIDLNGNPWFCEDLLVIIPALRDSRISHMRTQSNTFRNEDGIPCTYSDDIIYTQKTTSEVAVTTMKSENPKPVTVNPLRFKENLANVTSELREEIKKSNEEIMNSMEKTRNLIVSLIVLIVVFVALELTFRTGLINRVIARRGDNYVRAENVDNIALLTT